ncbi:hypothetical protein ACFP51_00100 [Streptomyces pratens]|uniref:Uncharacterized protein n=1 Tax=Streptomyces pratens TaxID=887456 RepID=A0ABW1LU45_9ACTN
MSAPPATAPARAAAAPYAAALRAGRGPLFLRRADGRLLQLKRKRRRARADAVDRDVLISETAPVDVDERTQMQVVGLTDAGGTDDLFPWARLGTRALLRYAQD